MNKTTIPQLLEAFFSKFHHHSYESGHIIQAAHSSPAGIYLVTSGMVKQYVLTAEGQEVVVNLYKPYSFFPMIGPLTGQSNIYFFESVGPVTAYLAPVEEALEFIRTTPEVSWDLLKRLYIGIDSLSQQMAYNSVGTVEQKVVVALINLAQRFGEKQGDVLIMTHHFTHKDISLMTGTSRESVSRVIEKLHKQGLITVDGRSIGVPNLNLLKAELHYF
jgi:CRP/FNR family transcriptional regulator